MSQLKATHQQTKKHNRDLVLKMIIDHESISRAEIARVTKLTRGSVSDIVSALIEEKLIKEIGYGKSIGGKAPILLSLVADSRFLIGLNLAQDKFIGSIVNLRGEIKESVDFPVVDSDGEKAIQLIYKILDRLISENWKPIVGIGIGTPGLVNSREGIVVNTVNLDWQDLNIAKLIETRYALPVKVLNDSQATAIGEFVYSKKHQSEDNLIVVTIRNGIGAGILINGSLFQGDGGGAGEIGHVVVEEDGELCQCGKYGCLQTVATTQAIVKRAANLVSEYNNSDLAKYPQNISLDAIKTAWKSNDPLARQVVTDAAVILGKSFANIVGVLNIHKIILSGDVVCFGDPWLEIVKDAMSNASFALLAKDTQIEFGQFDFQGCILGASAFMLLEDYSLLFSKD